LGREAESVGNWFAPVVHGTSLMIKPASPYHKYQKMMVRTKR
jgi:hypothetical protein